MEGYSVEDKGRGVCFNVFVYNVQPKITIDYATGKSSLSGDKSENSSVSDRKNSYSSARKKVSKVQRYILNTNTKNKSESSYKGNHQGFEPNFEPSFEPTGLDPQGFQAIDDDDIPF